MDKENKKTENDSALRDAAEKRLARLAAGLDALPAMVSDPAEHRRILEEQLSAEKAATGIPEPMAETMGRMYHELEVHQIELKMQNEELVASREETEFLLEKYSSLFDFAPVAFFTLDVIGIIQEVNLAGSTLLGIERSRLIKRPFSMYVARSSAPAFSSFMKELFIEQKKLSCEVPLVKEGSPSAGPYTHVRIEATLSEDGRQCLAAVLDITEHKQREEERLVLSKLESTGILAGGIAHDFNNLLSVILGNLEIIKSDIQPGGDTAMCLQDAIQAAKAASTLTRQLIAFAKGGASVKKVIALEPIVTENTTLALRGSPVSWNFAIPGDLWHAEVDAGQMGQVIRNIVLNAREAMALGGTIAVQGANVTLPSDDCPSLPAGQYIRISIADQGPGIPDDALPRIFDPYFSTKQRGTQKGMGLGLTVCHTIVRKHGGAITVQSELGIGTTFHIFLPAMPVASEKKKTPARKSVQGNGRILIMDDEESMRNVTMALLKKCGYDIEVAQDGQVAIECYKEAKRRGAPFDAVLLDLTVRGGLGGKDAIKVLLEFDPAAKVIVMSGYSEDTVILEYARFGFKAALAKPHEPTQLRETVARVIAGEE